MKKPQIIGIVALLSIAVLLPLTLFFSPLSADLSKTVIGNDDLKFSGHFVIEVIDPDGNLKAYRQTDNLIVTAGLGVASDLLFGTTHVSGEAAATMINVAVGTGTAAPVAGDTDIQFQASNKRQDASVTNSGSNGGVIDGTWLANTISNSSAIPITEAIIVDDINNATGNLFARQTFSPVNVNPADTLTVTWTITGADSDGS